MNIKGQNTISIERFLRDYCMIESEVLIELLSELSHQDLKEVCREICKLKLVSVPFDILDQSDLNCGDIILVSDSKNHVAPYKNPNKEIEIDINEVNLEAREELDREQLYDHLMDLLEDNATNPKVDISSVGSFDIPKKLILEKRD